MQQNMIASPFFAVVAEERRSHNYPSRNPVGHSFMLRVLASFRADGFITRMLDGQVRKGERAQVRFYSTQEYVTLFGKAELRYVALAQ